MAAKLAARKVPADTRRIEISLMGDRWIWFQGNRREVFPHQGTRRKPPEDANGA
jgi:hypothetical protein